VLEEIYSDTNHSVWWGAWITCRCSCIPDSTIS